MTVYLLQYLCPSRHAIVAAGYEAHDEPDREARRTEAEIDLLEIVRSHFNPWCGICGSNVLKFEEGTTVFANLEEAMPALKAIEVANLRARALVGNRY